MKNVTIYSTPTCSYCRQAKEFFKEKGIAYTEHNVATDLAKRKEMVDMTQQMGVPVIVVDGEVMVGYDQERLSQLLGV